MEFKHLEIPVEDTGIGISKKDLPKVFDRFQQLETNNVYGGAGIGLALTKELIERMNGQILISSQPE